MIPTLLVLGMIIGSLVRRRDYFRPAAVVLVLAALIFGVGVGVSNGEIWVFVGGTGLALANLLVGATITTAIGMAKRRLAA